MPVLMVNKLLQLKKPTRERLKIYNLNRTVYYINELLKIGMRSKRLHVLNYIHSHVRAMFGVVHSVTE